MSEVKKSAASSGKPTSKDAGRLFAIMLPLLFAVLAMIACISIAIKDDGATMFFGGFLVIIPMAIATLCSLPALIIGAKHRKELDSYKLFFWVGLIIVLLSLIFGTSAIIRLGSMFAQ